MGAGAWERRAAADAAARNQERNEGLRAERLRRENYLKSLSAQASRYSGQASQFDNVSRTVGQVSGSQPNSVLEAQRRRREQAERDRLARVQREQAEARVAQPDADERAQERLRGQFPADPLFGQSGTGVVRSFTPEEQAANRQALDEFAFGPESPSWVNVGQPASRPERFVRNWFLSEQEFRTAGERAREGAVLPAVGWGALGLAGVVPIGGDAAQALARGGRAAESAADVARTADAGQTRIAEIVRSNADELNRIKTERVQQMTRTDEVDQQALARASQAVRDMSPESIWVIHETSFPPMQSGRGVELRPTGDYRPETGRNTVHFTLNHTAAGHEMRGSLSAPYVVVARLSDVLEANPGSLDNLNAIDTFLTPAPGQSLNLPNAVVLQNSQSAQTQTAIRDLVEGSGGTIIDGGKRESLTIGADARIRQLARELNAPSVLHDNHPSYLLEMSHLSGGGMMNADPLYYLPLMSDNARLRAAQDDIWNRPSAPDRRQMVFKGEDDV